MKHLKKLPRRFSFGFTIVEVVVVIVIISILAGLGGAVYTNFRERSHNDTRATRAELITSALEQYYSRNGSYPSVAALTNKGEGNSPERVAEMLELTEQDITDPASNDPNTLSIVDYADYASSTDTVFRYRGFGDSYDCHENTYIGVSSTRFASLESVAALFPGYCEAYILSYRDTINDEWKQIYSQHNPDLYLGVEDGDPDPDPDPTPVSYFDAAGCTETGTSTLKYGEKTVEHKNYTLQGPGSTGKCVESIQRKLNTYCSTAIGTDGQYGPQTTNAVRAYQAYMSTLSDLTVNGSAIEVDGYAGSQTFALMQEFQASSKFLDCS